MILLLIAQWANLSLAFSLENYLEEVKKNNTAYQGLSESQKASEQKRIAGDIQLTPALTLKSTQFRDKKQPTQLGNTESKVDKATATYSQKLSTGTVVQLSADTTAYQNDGIVSPAFANFKKYSQGALGVSVQQSLWKDAFGKSTDLRRDREQALWRLESLGIKAQVSQLLIESEALFWDYIYLGEEIKIKEASLGRAKKIESWVSRRFKDGIADESDYLNAQALVAARELELSNSQDEFTAVEAKLKDQMGWDQTKKLPVFSGSLAQSRPIPKNENRVRIDALQTQEEALLKKAISLEAKEGLKPDLNLGLSYNTNSYAPNGTMSDATKDWQETETPTTAVALTFTYLFGTDAKDAALASANGEARASELRAQRKKLEAETAWTDFRRRYTELNEKINAAARISSLQLQRAKLESDKLSKGRSITSLVITAEQEAEEAHLRLTKLRAEQRKMESQLQLFELVSHQGER